MVGKNEITAQIKGEALTLGFDAVGIAKVENLDNEYAYMHQWIKDGKHGSMTYLPRSLEKRKNPNKVLENAKSAIVVLVNYYPPQKQQDDTYQIATYAYGKDYHSVIKNQLKKLEEKIHYIYGVVHTKVFVDSSSLFEKVLANKSGLGGIGKNTLFISPHLGSFCFIGTILTDIELVYDSPYKKDVCGNCSLCIDACPTQALISEGQLDARKCISYQTIESRDDFQLPESTHDCIYGCDICQGVCPHNKQCKPTNWKEFHPSKEFLSLSKKDWKEMTEEKYDSFFAHSPIKRSGFLHLKKIIDSNS